MKQIRIDNDNWEDSGKIWDVVEYQNFTNSSRVRFVLMNDKGEEEIRILPLNQIEWIGE